MNIDEIKTKRLELTIMILSALAVIMYFLPIYTLSLDILGTNVGTSISLCNFTFGITWNGVEYSQGHFGFIFTLLLPVITILVMIFVKTNKLVKYGVSILFAAIDLIILISVSGNSANADYGTLFAVGFETTFWLIIAYVVYVIIIIAGVLLLISSKGSIGANAQSLAKTINNTAEKANAVVNGVGVKKICDKCGAELTSVDTFCPKCGTKYVAPEPKKCQNCGTTLAMDEVFCHKCGTKYEKPVKLICPSCGLENPNGMQFCGKCGTKLVINESNNTDDAKTLNRCNKCGAENDLDATFCDKCGNKLS